MKNKLPVSVRESPKLKSEEKETVTVVERSSSSSGSRSDPAMLIIAFSALHFPMMISHPIAKCRKQNVLK